MKTITALSNTMMNTTKQFYLAGLGVAATMTDRSKQVFDQLVEKGEAASKKEGGSEATKVASGLTSRVKNAAEKAGDRLQEGLATTLGRIGVPSRNEIQALTRSVEALTEKVQGMQAKENIA